MATSTVLAVDPPPEPPEFSDYDSGLSIPPLDVAFLSQQLIDDDGAVGYGQTDIDLDDFDFDLDFSFDDVCTPDADGLEYLLDPTQIQELDLQFHAKCKPTSPDLGLIPGEGDLSGDHCSNCTRVMTSTSCGMESHQISGHLNVPSPDSNRSNREISENCGGDEKVLNCPSPESRCSENCRSNVLEESNNGVRSVSSSRPNLSDSSIITGVVNQKVKPEERAKTVVISSLLKRKKDYEDSPIKNVESRINKQRKSNSNAENNNKSNNNTGLSEEEEKRKTRLMRNRESAHLSRQRKRHYVEELEDKVRSMHSTIQDLNAKISYFMAENATLRQQMGCGAPAVPPPMAVPPPGMYQHPAMTYPWMPYVPSYMMKPHGSQVPLVPIPRLKTQQTAQAPKVSKKEESKKNEGAKMKKVTGISFLGLLFFIMLFGGLLPMINTKYEGVRETFTGVESYRSLYRKHHESVLMLNGTDHGEKYGDIRDSRGKSGLHYGQRGCEGEEKPSVNNFVRLSNGTEALLASLYVPKNDKLVKIDGNLIIHSVLASEKAMSSHGKRVGESGPAIPGDLAPVVPILGSRHPHLRALASGSAENDKKPTATAGGIQEWFREGLAGPMFSSGMCTEVFQFDISSASASGAIIASATARNISDEQNQNSTQLSKGRNRRILHRLPIPVPESSRNISRQGPGISPQKKNLNGNNSASPMVVSVLVDPREADADVDGVIGTKSLSRIFVVVLIDSVKYVTYSCVLPFKGSTPLVTA